MTPFARRLTRDVSCVTLSCNAFRCSTCNALLRAILTAVKRCWAGDDDPLMLAYHDREWGVPLHGDRELFAKLVLDGFQAGLSWSIILHKRARFLEAFDGFDPERMARYDRKKIVRLLKDPGIVRNRQKVNAAIGNARAFLEFQERTGAFGDFLWGFVGGTPKQYRRRAVRDLPARTRESDAMSVALTERRFRFVGQIGRASCR